METREKKSAGQSGADDNQVVRTRTVKFLCTDEEQLQIAQLSQQMGYKTVAQYVREKALANNEQDHPKAVRNALYKCFTALNRMGNNINQIARMLNYGIDVDRATYGAMKDIKRMAYELLEEAKKGNWSQK